MSALPLRIRPLLIQLIVAGLVILGSACDTTTKVIVQNEPEAETNRPPTIVQQGPAFPPEGFEEISYGSPYGINLWVLIADPDGIDDISLVTASVDSVRLARFLLRPDTSTTSCSRFSYMDNDTITTDAILPVPETFPGFSFAPLTRVQGGLFQMSNFGSVGFPDLVEASPLLERWQGGCYSGSTGILGPIVVLPPAVPIRRTAILTYADVEYRGITVTVYDKVGATATTTFPDVRIVFTSPEERTAAP